MKHTMLRFFFFLVIAGKCPVSGKLTSLIHRSYTLIMLVTDSVEKMLLGQR